MPVTEQPVAKNFSINNMVMEERMRQGQPPPWHEQDEIDSTRVSTTVVCIYCESNLIEINFLCFLTLIIHRRHTKLRVHSG